MSFVRSQISGIILAESYFSENKTKQNLVKLLTRKIKCPPNNIYLFFQKKKKNHWIHLSDFALRDYQLSQIYERFSP